MSDNKPVDVTIRPSQEEREELRKRLERHLPGDDTAMPDGEQPAEDNATLPAKENVHVGSVFTTTRYPLNPAQDNDNLKKEGKQEVK